MILIDTNVLVALVDPRDPLRERVLADYEKLKRPQFLLPSVVLAECGYILKYPFLRKKLRALLKELLIEPYALSEEARLWDDIFDWLAKYGEHRPDMTDAFLVILAHRDRSLKIWTYDSEFWEIWRLPDGRAVPLAATAPR